ncbi:hypothetical protein V494_02935, partial [Pseudogymnoascus sp. VKM F-4513 (FW-928)]
RGQGGGGAAGLRLLVGQLLERRPIQGHPRQLARPAAGPHPLPGGRDARVRRRLKDDQRRLWHAVVPRHHYREGEGLLRRILRPHPPDGARGAAARVQLKPGLGAAVPLPRQAHPRCAIPPRQRSHHLGAISSESSVEFDLRIDSDLNIHRLGVDSHYPSDADGTAVNLQTVSLPDMAHSPAPQHPFATTS